MQPGKSICNDSLIASHVCNDVYSEIDKSIPSTNINPKQLALSAYIVVLLFTMIQRHSF